MIVSTALLLNLELDPSGAVAQVEITVEISLSVIVTNLKFEKTLRKKEH